MVDWVQEENGRSRARVKCDTRRPSLHKDQVHRWCTVTIITKSAEPKLMLVLCACMLAKCVS